MCIMLGLLPVFSLNIKQWMMSFRGCWMRGTGVVSDEVRFNGSRLSSSERPRGLEAPLKSGRQSFHESAHLLSCSHHLPSTDDGTIYHPYNKKYLGNDAVDLRSMRVRIQSSQTTPATGLKKCI